LLTLDGIGLSEWYFDTLVELSEVNLGQTAVISPIWPIAACVLVT